MSKHATTVEKLRAERDALLEQLPALDDAPLPAAEAVAAFRDWFKKERDDWQKRMAYRLTHFRVIDANHPAEILAFPPNTDGSGDAGALAWLLGDTIEQRCVELLQDLSDVDAIPRADREPRRKKMKARLAEIERLEEQAIRAAESAGEPIDRRDDADPRVVLMPDEPLTREAA